MAVFGIGRTEPIVCGREPVWTDGCRIGSSDDPEGLRNLPAGILPGQEGKGVCRLSGRSLYAVRKRNRRFDCPQKDVLQRILETVQREIKDEEGNQSPGGK